MAELFLLVFLNEPKSAVRVAKGTKGDSGVGFREEGGKAVIKEPTKILVSFSQVLGYVTLCYGQVTYPLGFILLV